MNTDRKLNPIRIPLPGLRREVGLGQLVKRVTTAMGAKPCGPCAERARRLDQRLVLGPLPKK